MIRMSLDEALRRASRDDEAPDTAVTAESVLATLGQEAPDRAGLARWWLAALAVLLAGVLALLGRNLWSTPTPDPSSGPSASTDPTSTPSTAFEWVNGDPQMQPMDDALALARCPARTGERVWAEGSQQFYGGRLVFVPVGATPAPDDYQMVTRECALGYDRQPLASRLTTQELAGGQSDQYLRLCSQRTGMDLARARFRPLGQASTTSRPTGGQGPMTLAVFAHPDGWLASCTLIPGQQESWLEFNLPDSGTSVCTQGGLYIDEVSQDAEGKPSQAVSVRTLGVAPVMAPGTTAPDIRVATVRITAKAPWNVDLTRPVHEGILISVDPFPLPHAVSLAHENEFPQIPTTVRALDARGKVLFTCTTP